MSELTIADGFVEINENVGGMIKYVANEPSVGLYYIQQHVHNAVPNVIRLKNTVVEKSHDVSLQTEDLEDSIAMTRSMKECGPPIIDDMVKDIKASLTVMSTRRRPIRGAIRQRSSRHQILGSDSWAPVSWVRRSVSTQNESDNRGSYLANVMKSAKEKAGWAQLDPPPLLDEAKDLSVSSQVEDPVTDGNSQPVSASNGYEEFKANKEAKLEEWLKGSGTRVEEQREGHHDLDSL